MTSQVALVVEDCSPHEGVSQTLKRMLQFLKSGVPLVWLVDIEDRSVVVYIRGDESSYFGESEELTGKYVFPDMPVRVSELLPEVDGQNEKKR